MDSMNSLFSNSSNSTLSSFAILTNKAISGCDELVHHLETVEGLMPNSVASHLLVFCFFCQNYFYSIYPFNHNINSLTVKLMKIFHFAIAKRSFCLFQEYKPYL